MNDKDTKPRSDDRETGKREFSFRFTTRNLTALGLLLALEIVLSRFLSVAAWNMKIGFSFVPVVVAAVVFGPVSAAVVAGLGDLLGALLFPIGPYFPGFTLTAILTGLTFGLFLYRRRSVPRALGAVLVAQPVLSLLLNSLWISVLYGSPFSPLLVSRIPQTIIHGVLELALIWALSRNEKFILMLKDR